MLSKALFLSLILLPSTSFAREVDNFTNRFHPLEDALVALNEKANEWLQMAADEYNKKSTDGEGCDANELFEHVYSAQRGRLFGFFGTFERYINSGGVDRVFTPFEQSIYATTSATDRFLMVLPGIAIGSMFKLDGHLIGADKLGHFVDEGAICFRQLHVEGLGTDVERLEILRWGWETEGPDGIRGMQNTGVQSFGDMVANYEGLRFYENLTMGHDPYFECRDNKYAKRRAFDWREYVTDMMDEAVNCDNFRNERMRAAVEGQIAKLNRALKINFQCPMKPDSCREGKKRYGAYARYLLHPACLSVQEPLSAAKPAVGPSASSGSGGSAQRAAEGTSR